jgi:hypothetical protein
MRMRRRRLFGKTLQATALQMRKFYHFILQQAFKPHPTNYVPLSSNHMFCLLPYHITFTPTRVLALLRENLHSAKSPPRFCWRPVWAQFPHLCTFCCDYLFTSPSTAPLQHFTHSAYILYTSLSSVLNLVASWC